MTQQRSTSTCLNCGAVPTGLYCQACGQKTGAERFRLLPLLEEIPHAVFHVDRGFFSTLRRLASHPGQAIRGYLDGQRVRYFNPITLLALTAGLSALLYSAYPFSLLGADGRVSAEFAQKYSEFSRLNFKYYSFTLLIYLPLLALITQACFAGLGPARARTYAEHLVINSYIMGFVSFLMVLAFPAMVATNDSPAFRVLWSTMTVVILLYQCVALHATFVEPGNAISTAVRTALAMLAYMLMLLVVTQGFFWLVYVRFW